MILICCISIISSSCSDDNDNQSSKLDPPSWTYGTWKDKEGLYTAKFASDNLIFGNEVMPLNFSEAVKSSGMSVIELVNTDSEYKIKFAESTFHFRKKSNNQIAFVLADNPEQSAEWLLYKVE